MKLMFWLALIAGICGLVTGRFGFVITGLVIVLAMFIMKFLEWYLPPQDEPLEYFPGSEDDPRWKHHFTED